MNRNVVAAISYNEYKDVLLNNKCIRHPMNKMQRKNHRIGTYEIKNVSLSCFDDEIYIQNNGCDGLALGYQKKQNKKNSYPNNCVEKLFCQAYYFNFQSNQDSFLVNYVARLLARHIKFEKWKALKIRKVKNYCQYCCSLKNGGMFAM